MDLMEYISKELFLKYNISATYGVTADSVNELQAENNIIYPVMVKAQVPAGGRGKAGGIKYVTNRDEMLEAAEAIFKLKIKGYEVKKVMVTAAAEIEKEIYLAITLDRSNMCPVILYSESGGIDIESNASLIRKVQVNPLIGPMGYTSRYLNSSPEFDKILNSLYRLFIDYDCSLCEINPLAITPEGDFIAVDGKIVIDDSALYRHSDLDVYRNLYPKNKLAVEAEKYGFLYIPCEQSGDISVISNGSGMLMSCIDAISKENMAVLATLDLGGGATAERIREAIRIVASEAGVSQILINIFGGITRCDEVALGIKDAFLKYDIKIPFTVRLEGTNKEAGLEILRPLGNILNASGLAEAVKIISANKKTGGFPV